MKEKIETAIIVFVCFSVVFGLLWAFSYFGTKGIREDIEMCSEKLGIEWNGEYYLSSNIRYEEIDETHYNCCLVEVTLSDKEGYWEKERKTECKGFQNKIELKD